MRPLTLTPRRTPEVDPGRRRPGRDPYRRLRQASSRAARLTPAARVAAVPLLPGGLGEQRQSLSGAEVHFGGRHGRPTEMAIQTHAPKRLLGRVAQLTSPTAHSTLTGRAVVLRGLRSSAVGGRVTTKEFLHRWRGAIAVIVLFLIVATVTSGNRSSSPDTSVADKARYDNTLATCEQSTQFTLGYGAWVVAVNHCLAHAFGVSYADAKKIHDANSR